MKKSIALELAAVLAEDVVSRCGLWTIAPGCQGGEERVRSSSLGRGRDAASVRNPMLRPGSTRRHSRDSERAQAEATLVPTPNSSNSAASDERCG